MLFDTHCHLDVAAFDADREEVFARAQAAGVTHFLNPAYDLDSSRRAVALAGQHTEVYAAVGVHPNDLAALESDGLAQLRMLATQPKVVAIGEVGLDYYWNTFSHERQQAAFEQQLALAQELDLSVIVHCRDAYDDTLDILERFPAGRVLLHSFAGNGGHAERALARGYSLGISGPVTFKKADTLREIVRDAPLERLLLETDAPYLAPHPRRGQRNEPGLLTLTAQKVAEIRALPMDELAQATSANAYRFFGLTL
ncbi:MAG: TatD family hydrolase [Chloroflexi bacterium]|nr:TatD family hydrolase [Chloroflexota bacterium]